MFWGWRRRSGLWLCGVGQACGFSGEYRERCLYAISFSRPWRPDCIARAVPRGSETEAREARAMARQSQDRFRAAARPPLKHFGTYLSPWGLSHFGFVRLGNVHEMSFPDPWRPDCIPRAVPIGSRPWAREARTMALHSQTLLTNSNEPPM